jgi:fatty acid desaturase
MPAIKKTEELETRESALARELKFSAAVSAAVRPLLKMNPLRGVAKSLGFLIAFIALVCLSLVSTVIWIKFAAAILASLLYICLVSMLHDALHGALTGIKWYDETLGRLISYPLFHLYGLFKFLHLSHHRTNALQLEDPERYQITASELESKSKFGRWLVQRGVFAECLFGGAIGLLIRFYRQIPGAYRKHRECRILIVSDIAGIFLLNGLLIGTICRYGMILDYLLVFFCIERIAGLIHQMVSRLAHNENWFLHSKFIPNQIANTRVVKGPWIVSFFLNNLNWHIAHHAFLNVPYYRLPEATQVIKELRNDLMPELRWDEAEDYWQVLADPKKNKTLIIADRQT